MPSSIIVPYLFFLGLYPILPLIHPFYKKSFNFSLGMYFTMPFLHTQTLGFEDSDGVIDILIFSRTSIEWCLPFQEPPITLNFSYNLDDSLCALFIIKNNALIILPHFT